MNNYQCRIVSKGDSIWNVEDTSEEKWPSGFDSWTNFWERCMNLRFPDYCPVCGTKFVFDGKEMPMGRM